MQTSYVPSEIEIDKVRFNVPVRNSRHHISYLQYDNKTMGILVQTSKVTIKKISSDYVEFYCLRKVDRQRMLYNLLRSIEQLAVDSVVNNSMAWFNKDLKYDTIVDMFRSSIVCPEDIDSQFVIRIPRSKLLEIDDGGSPVDSGSGGSNKAIMILKIDGLIFGKNMSTLKAEVVQLKFIKDTKQPVTFQEDEVEGTVENFYNDAQTVIDTSAVDLVDTTEVPAFQSEEGTDVLPPIPLGKEIEEVLEIPEVSTDNVKTFDGIVDDSVVEEYTPSEVIDVAVSGSVDDDLELRKEMRAGIRNAMANRDYDTADRLTGILRKMM